jgi:hypothetical protein
VVCTPGWCNMVQPSRAVLLRAVGAVLCFLLGTVAHPAAAQEQTTTFATPSPPYLDPWVTDVPPINSATPCQTDGDSDGCVVLRSIFGKPDPSTWRPLSLATLFSEGWDEAWVPSPSGSGGGLRHAWINAAFGTLPRAYFFTFSQGFNEAPKGNGYLGAYTLVTPFNRRLELITNVPFVLRNSVETGLPVINPPAPPLPPPPPPPPGLPRIGPPGQSLTTTQSHTGFGDISFTPRVLLHETQDLSITAELAVSTPTGTRPIAGNRTALTPNVSFWNNIAGRVVVRGGVGVLFPTDGSGDELIGQLALGQTLTDHDVPFFGDFTYYLAAVVNTPLSNSDLTRVTLTPGIRTHVGHDWYFLAGLPTPVTKERVADLGMILWFMKAW